MKRIPISLTDQEHELLKQESERTGLSRAEIIRELIPLLKHKNNNIKVDVRKINRGEWGRQIKERDNYKCNYCGFQGQENTTVAHHRIPINRGGSEEMENGVTYCKPCHRIVHIILDKIL